MGSANISSALMLTANSTSLSMDSGSSAIDGIKGYLEGEEDEQTLLEVEVRNVIVITETLGGEVMVSMSTHRDMLKTLGAVEIAKAAIVDSAIGAEDE